MEEMQTNFLREIKWLIIKRLCLQSFYKIFHVLLMVLIATCGFLTAAASQKGNAETLIAKPGALLTFGLLSAICAVVNQVLSPTEKHNEHRDVKKALQHVEGAVKYQSMPLNQAQDLRMKAITEPSIVLAIIKEPTMEAPPSSQE